MNEQPPAFYYADANGQQVGPVHLSDILDLIVSGVLSDATLVWWDQLDNWMPLNSHPTLADALARERARVATPPAHGWGEGAPAADQPAPHTAQPETANDASPAWPVADAAESTPDNTTSDNTVGDGSAAAPQSDARASESDVGAPDIAAGHVADIASDITSDSGTDGGANTDRGDPPVTSAGEPEAAVPYQPPRVDAPRYASQIVPPAEATASPPRSIWAAPEPQIDTQPSPEPQVDTQPSPEPQPDTAVDATVDTTLDATVDAAATPFSTAPTSETDDPPFAASAEAWTVPQPESAGGWAADPTPHATTPDDPNIDGPVLDGSTVDGHADFDAEPTARWEPPLANASDSVTPDPITADPITADPITADPITADVTPEAVTPDAVTSPMAAPAAFIAGPVGADAHHADEPEQPTNPTTTDSHSDIIDVSEVSATEPADDRALTTPATAPVNTDGAPPAVTPADAPSDDPADAAAYAQLLEQSAWIDGRRVERHAAFARLTEAVALVTGAEARDGGATGTIGDRLVRVTTVFASENWPPESPDVAQVDITLGSGDRPVQRSLSWPLDVDVDTHRRRLQGALAALVAEAGD